ncbi:hypothetical protein [Lysobacter sp. TAB13]|jgi:zinc transporter ZupT|uniref:hypothetical protein n=1 Tax=Lysobacter sp. TAB13 TaxID=3233065 RepID=UPI003F9AC258
MQEPQFGSRYSLSDLQPVWPVMLAVLLAELIGAAIGYYALSAPHPILRLWLGAALAALPGYALGLILQRKLRPDRFRTHRPLIRRLGVLAALLTLTAVGILICGLDALLARPV